MTTLEHLQKVILHIAKDIDKLCKQNNIEYYLCGGSAIGAIRHKGFIPWDDDLDIFMTRDNYEKFIKVCREYLDPEKYYVQEGGVDWPLPFSKIKLKGTTLNEYEAYAIKPEMQGIYVDVFYLDNVSDSRVMAKWQYICAKMYLSYCLGQRTYKSASFKKRVMMYCASILRVKIIRNFIIRQTTKYNDKQTERVGFYSGRTRFKTGTMNRDILGTPKYIAFEDTMLPVPENYDAYLTQVFGDYMQLPPESQRVGLHLIDVDFGKY